ncbi:MAG: hypothetical protein ACI4CC_01515 [Lachnospiraceae bacterium]
MKYTKDHPGFDYGTELSEKETFISIFVDTMELRLPVGDNRRPIFHFVFNLEPKHTGEYFGAPPDEWYMYTGISFSSKEIWEIRINDELRLNLHHAEVALHSYLKEKQNNIKHWVIVKLYDNLIKDGDYQVIVTTTPGVSFSADAARGLMIAMRHGTLQTDLLHSTQTPICQL